MFGLEVSSLVTPFFPESDHLLRIEDYIIHLMLKTWLLPLLRYLLRELTIARLNIHLGIVYLSRF